MPLDEPSRNDPAVMLAGRIAETIGKWLPPESRDRVAAKKARRDAFGRAT